MYPYSTPSILQTPMLIPSSPMLSHSYSSSVVQTNVPPKVERCFNPYNNETMEDIKKDLIRLGTITEKELDGDNGLINRIRRLSFYDANQYGILRRRTTSDLDFKLDNAYIDIISNERYIIHNYNIYKSKNMNDISLEHIYDEKYFEEVDKLDNIPIYKVFIIVKHDSCIDNSKCLQIHMLNKYASKNTYKGYISKSKYIEIDDYNSNYMSSMELFGCKFNINSWGDGYITWSCNENLNNFAIDINENNSMGNITKLYNSLIREESCKKDKTYMTSSSIKHNIEKLYKKCNIGLDINCKDVEQLFKDKSNVYNYDRIPNKIDIDHTVLNIQSEISEEYKNIPVIIKDKYKRWTGTAKKTHSLYGLIEKIHQEGVYHGTINDSTNRDNVIIKDGNYYLNQCNWTSSSPKSIVKEDTIVEDADELTDKIVNLLKEFSNKHSSHPRFQEQYYRAWNNIK